MKRNSKKQPQIKQPLTLVSFTCDECLQHKTEACYLLTLDQRQICCECAGKLDAKDLAELEYGETMELYYDEKNFVITNRTQTLTIPVDQAKTGGHNFAGTRTDIYFHFAGNGYHGVQLGSRNQIARIKKLIPKTALKKTALKKISEKNLWPDESFQDEKPSKE